MLLYSRRVPLSHWRLSYMLSYTRMAQSTQYNLYTFIITCVDIDFVLKIKCYYDNAHAIFSIYSNIHAENAVSGNDFEGNFSVDN